MIGFNHAAVGCFVGKFLPLPIAIPLALASHFAMDMMPHYGIPHHRRDERFWKYFFIADFFAAWGLGVFAAAHHNYAMFFCGLVAASPDFVWVTRAIKTKSFNMSGPKSKFAQWHAGIQHYERPWGIFVELPIAAILCYYAISTW